MKISIIGLGHVGSTLAYSIAFKGLASELTLINRTTAKAYGDCMDMRQSMLFSEHKIKITHGDLEACEGADIVCITVSVPPPNGASNRMALAEGNVAVYREIIPQIAKLCPNAILLIISNPVDVLSYLSIQYSGFAPEKVIGTGTFIDSIRFREQLSKALEIHPDDLRAYILGEHGETQFPLLSTARTAGVEIGDLPEVKECFQDALNMSYDIFKSKGYTNYAIATASCYIIESIVNDSRRTMPLSCLIEDYAGVNDVCLSIPVVIGRGGIVKKLHPKMSVEEEMKFQKSAQHVRQVIDQFN